MPLYSTTIALAGTAEERVIVSAWVALLIFNAYQISTVTSFGPLTFGFRFFTAGFHCAPVWVIVETMLSLPPRVPITAISALPLAGAVSMSTSKEVELLFEPPPTRIPRIGVQAAEWSL